MLGFELAWQLEDLQVSPRARQTPDIWVGAYPSALVYSHREDAWWLTGDPQTPASLRLRQALNDGERGRQPGKNIGPKNQNLKTLNTVPGVMFSPPGAPLRPIISPEEYARRAEKLIRAIHAGELDQINYTERFTTSWAGPKFALYERLRTRSTGAYCAYLDAGDFQLASLSPEQFLSVRGRELLTRPIKGTLPRGKTPAEDAALADELRMSAKDRAENMLAVDAIVEELSRICDGETIQVIESCGLYSFAGVHHLISTISAKLQPELSALDAMLACFPPGSITGAPKSRAIELIAQTEEDARGPYTGALFYASDAPDRLDSSVLIRTLVMKEGQVWYGAGGALVADSDPEAEYREARLKAAAVAALFDEMRR